ncbi:MAG: glycosyltransferase family 2 protein [Acidobacteriota bacterium]
MPVPLLSLCLIVRDEAERLESCLSSAAGLVDEIVVADTGSQDETVVLARKLGARVVELTWRDDFAAARNGCMTAARGEWVLFIDADEQLEPCDPLALRALLGKDQAPGYSVEIVSPRGDNRQEVAHIVRLFRRRPEFQFEGRIHESILPSIARSLGREFWAPPRSGLKMRHDGYRPELRAARDKDERNRRLLRRAIEAAPDDPGPRFLYARERLPQIDGDLVDTLEARTTLEIVAPAADRLSREPARGVTDPTLSIAARLAHCCGQPARAARWREIWRDLCGASARWCYATGEALMLESPTVARQAFRDAVEAPEGCEAIPTEAEMRGAWSAARIAATWIIEGNREQLNAALTKVPPNEARLLEAIVIARQQGAGAALAMLLAMVRDAPHDPRGWWALARALAEVQENEKAAAMLATALRCAPGWSAGSGIEPSGLLSLWPT